MKITFEKKKNEKDHLVIIYKNKLSFNQLALSTEQINLADFDNVKVKK